MDQVPRDGFLILEYGAPFEPATVLWGEFVPASDVGSYYLLHDLDGDSIPEAFTFFLDDSSIWGYVHRITRDGLRVSLQTLEIPQSDYDEPETKDIRSGFADQRLIMPGRSNGGETITVFYNPESDSLALELK